jgi:branched-chain amino acid transport system substrate-binding protein
MNAHGIPKKKAVGIVTFLALVLIGGGSSLGAEPIKFGVSTAISGDAAAYGKPFLEAILMMADIFNEEGGILGRPVKVVYYDDRGVPDQALKVCKKLVYGDKVEVLQPGSTSGCIMTGMPVGKAGKVAMWGYGLAKDWLLQSEGTIWRCAVPDEVNLAALARYAIEKLGVKTCGILHLDTFYGETAKNVFKQWFEELGGRITKVTSYTEGDRDFSSQFMMLSAGKPGAVFIVAQAGAYAPALRQVRQFMPKDVEVLGEIGLYNPYLRKETGELVNGIYYYSHPAVDVNPDPLVRKWLGECRKRVGSYNEIMARAIVGMSVMREAIKRAGTTNSIAVMKEVHKLKDFPTPMGPYTYDPRDGEGLKTGIVISPTKGADLAGDVVVYKYTTTEDLYHKPIKYKRFFGNTYYKELLQYHGLK